MGLYKSSKLFILAFFDDISRIKDTFDNDLYQSGIELVTIEDHHVF